MKNNAFPWHTKKTTCVILAAGKGTRAYPATIDMPKVILPIHGVPAIKYVIDFWTPLADDFIFVVGYKKEMVIDYVKTLPIKAQFVEQKELKGIAHAVAQTHHLISDNFIVVLGDCCCKGTFSFPPSMEQGVGIWHTEDDAAIHQSYSVNIQNNTIIEVVEKPQNIINRWCGMGYYFFSPKVFNYIQQTPPSALRNEIEITNVLQTMIQSGESLTPIPFHGEYINITYGKDPKRYEGSEPPAPL